MNNYQHLKVSLEIFSLEDNESMRKHKGPWLLTNQGCISIIKTFLFLKMQQYKEKNIQANKSSYVWSKQIIFRKHISNIISFITSRRNSADGTIVEDEREDRAGEEGSNHLNRQFTSLCVNLTVYGQKKGRQIAESTFKFVHKFETYLFSK